MPPRDLTRTRTHEQRRLAADAAHRRRMNWALYGLGVAASVAAVVTGHAWYLVALVPATFRALRGGQAGAVEQTRPGRGARSRQIT